MSRRHDGRGAGRRRVVLATILPAVLGLAVALWIPGCGSSRIIVNVDVLSFLPASDAHPVYGEPVPIPPGAPPVAVQIGPDRIQVPEGLSDVSKVEDADAMVKATVTNNTGSADLRLRLYFAPAGEDPFATAPAAVFAVSVLPGSTTPVENTVPLTKEARLLFEQAELQFAYDVQVDAGNSSQAVQGQVDVETMRIRVVNNPDIGN